MPVVCQSHVDNARPLQEKRMDHAAERLGVVDFSVIYRASGMYIPLTTVVGRFLNVLFCFLVLLNLFVGCDFGVCCAPKP